jgi:transposase InsO family protein
MCRVLGISRSGYYAWVKRPPSPRAVRDAHRTKAVQASHARADGTDGAPRILADLQEAGERVGRKCVARLMREAGVVGVHRRRGVRTTRRGPDETAATDRVKMTSLLMLRTTGGWPTSRMCLHGPAFCI